MDTSAPIAVSPLLHADKSAADTPALLVDLDALEANIATIADACRRNGINWRPHTKGIKVPQIARKLIDAGAIGLTCAKLGEAEVMAAAGFSDILIANQIVGPQKIARLVALRRCCDVIVAVDDPRQCPGDRRSRPRRRCRRSRSSSRSTWACDAPASNRARPASRSQSSSRRRRASVCRLDGLGRPDRAGLPMQRKDRGDHRGGRRHRADRRGVPQGRPAGRYRELRRYRHLLDHGRTAGRHRNPGRRRRVLRRALPQGLRRRASLCADRHDHGDQPADAEPDHLRRRQEDDEHRRRDARADRPRHGARVTPFGRTRRDRAQSRTTRCASAIGSNGSSAIPTPRCTCTTRSMRRARGRSRRSGRSSGAARSGNA